MRPLFVTRLLEVLNSWLAAEGRNPVQPLSGEDLMHAVARGAAYYGAARNGKGVRIRGGIGRSYYVGIESAMPAVPGFAPPLKALAVAQFGMEEGSSAPVPDREFGLIVGQPAEFRFFCSAVRKDDAPGAMIEDLGGELEELSPIEVRLTADGQTSEIVPVSFETVITENRHVATLVRVSQRPSLETGIQRSRNRMKVGIDLGTTNSALAWIDPAEAEDTSFPANSRL